MRVDERLLKYVSYWTTSSEDSDTIPSTDRQFNLAKELEKELLDLGLQKVTLTDHCYIYGLIPATPGYEDKKAVGFISHMDTAPDFSGKNVKPQIIPDYNGEDVILKGTGDVLKTSDFPELKTLKGRTLITTDGTTLLGADDKAGVAEIMTAAEQLTVSSEGFHEVERRVLVESRLEVKGNLPFSCSRHVSPIRCIAWRAPGDASMGARHPAALAVEG